MAYSSIDPRFRAAEVAAGYLGNFEHGIVNEDGSLTAIVQSSHGFSHSFILEISPWGKLENLTEVHADGTIVPLGGFGGSLYTLLSKLIELDSEGFGVDGETLREKFGDVQGVVLEFIESLADTVFDALRSAAQLNSTEEPAEDVATDEDGDLEILQFFIFGDGLISLNNSDGAVEYQLDPGVSYGFNISGDELEIEGTIRWDGEDTFAFDSSSTGSIDFYIIGGETIWARVDFSKLGFRIDTGN